MIWYSDKYKEIRAFELEARQANSLEELYVIQDRIKYWLRVEFRDTIPEALEVKKECESVMRSIESNIAILKAQSSTTPQKKRGNPQSTPQAEKEYSHRQIAIAYFFVKGFRIDSSSAADLLKKHSKTISVSKLLSKRISSTNNLALLSGNHTTDTKHLQDLEAAKRLLIGINNDEAVKDITRIITAFETSYKLKY